MQRHEMEPHRGNKPDGWTMLRLQIFAIACLTGVLIAKTYAMLTG
jgi:hypothetical protein